MPPLRKQTETDSILYFQWKKRVSFTCMWRETRGRTYRRGSRSLLSWWRGTDCLWTSPDGWRSWSGPVDERGVHFDWSHRCEGFIPNTCWRKVSLLIIISFIHSTSSFNFSFVIEFCIKYTYSAFPHTAVLSAVLRHSIDVNIVVMGSDSQEVTV